MRKLNIRKRPVPAEAPRPDALVMVAYASSWWSSRLVLPTLIGCGSIAAVPLLVSESLVSAVVLSIALGAAAVALGVRRHRQLRRQPIMEIWTNHLTQGDERLDFAELSEVDLRTRPIVGHVWWWRKWELNLDWQMRGTVTIDTEVADHDRAIDAVLRNLPTKFLSKLNQKRVRRALR